MKRVPVSGPWITSKEVEYVTDAARNAWYENANVYHQRFERAFADMLGVQFAVSLPSCTSGIHLSLLALGIGPGDEVVVPDLTWIASVAPVSYVGATPVFADIDRASWCLSPPALEAAVGPRTKAIIPVDLYGNMPEFDAIREIAKRRGIPVVEDAAEAIGSKYRGKLAGTFGDAAVFSFHGSKTVTTGEGGMLVTDSEALYKRVMTLRDHGRPPGDKMFVNTEVAHKYKMSAMQAAMGLAQIERLDELVRRKREIFGWYEEELQDVRGVTLNSEAADVLNTYWMVTTVIDPALGWDKVKLMSAMSDRGIDCRPIFSPLSSLPAFQGHPSSAGARERNPNSYAVGPYGINLPSGFNMDRATVQRVTGDLKAILSS